MTEPKPPKQTRKQDSTVPTRVAAREHRNFWLTFISTAIAAAALTGGVVHSYESQVFEVKKLNLELEYKEKEGQLKAEYQQLLRSLQLTLGDQKQYFDVTKFLIPAAEVYNLPSNFRSFQPTEDISFYVADYPGEDWEFSQSTEFDLNVMMVGQEQALKDARRLNLYDELQRARIFLFRHPDEFALDLRDRIRNPEAAPELTFFPVILLQPVDHALISEEFTGKAHEIETLLRSGRTPKDVFSTAPAEAKAAAILRDFYRADFAGSVLNSIVDQGFEYMTDYQGVEYHLTDMQKKGNILFIQSTLFFRDIKLKDVSDPVVLRVDDLVFFVSGPSRSFLVRASIPSYGGESKHLDWVRRWLTGFKFVWTY